MTNSLPFLILVGSGSERRHGYVLADMSNHSRILLLNAGEISWQKKFMTDGIQVEDNTPEAFVRNARDLVRKYGVEHVVTYDETMLTTLGAITDATDLVGLGMDAATVVKHKDAQRQRLKGCGSVVSSKLVTNAHDALTTAGQIGYPVALKPRSLSGHLGARFAFSEHEISRAFEEASAPFIRDIPSSGGVVVEEFLEGPEFTIDCWCLDGQAEVLYAARALMHLAPNTTDKGFIMGPGIATPSQVAAMKDAACKAAIACGLDRTIANVDVKLTKGVPRILEVNGRPGGMVPLLALETSGLRIGKSLVEVAMGHRPEAPAPDTHAAGLAFIFPRRSGVFNGLNIPGAVSEKDWCLRVGYMMDIGARISPPDIDPWGYVAWVLIVGETADEVEANIDEVRAQVEVICG